MHTIKGHKHAGLLRPVLETLLGDIEPGVQRLALVALKLWRLPYLNPYLEQLEKVRLPVTQRGANAS